MLAVAHNKQEMVNLLLEANCAVNLQDFDGSTALMSAAEHNHVDIVKLLLDHPDIDVSLKDQVIIELSPTVTLTKLQRLYFSLHISLIHFLRNSTSHEKGLGLGYMHRDKMAKFN